MDEKRHGDLDSVIDVSAYYDLVDECLEDGIGLEQPQPLDNKPLVNSPEHKPTVAKTTNTKLKLTKGFLPLCLICTVLSGILWLAFDQTTIGLDYKTAEEQLSENLLEDYQYIAATNDFLETINVVKGPHDPLFTAAVSELNTALGTNPYGQLDSYKEDFLRAKDFHFIDDQVIYVGGE